MYLYYPYRKNRATAIFALKPYKARKQENMRENARKQEQKRQNMLAPVNFLPELPIYIKWYKKLHKMVAISLYKLPYQKLLTYGYQ